MTGTALGKTDRRILELLQKDGRMTNLELAERVALSPSACLRRVRALEEAGVIRGYAALLDPAKVGLGLLAFVTVKLEKRGRMPTDAFAKACRDWPEVPRATPPRATWTTCCACTSRTSRTSRAS